MKESRREKIAATLRQEIMDGTFDPHRPLPGEHALCRRFDVSRGTVRLALDDLVRRGLIYRRHGSGTYVNPVRSVMQRSLGLLLLEPQKSMTVGNLPLISGAGAYLESVGSQLVILSSPPQRWSAGLIEDLAGVMVVAPLVREEDLAHLSRLGLPAMGISESDLPLPSIRYGFETAVREVTEWLLSYGHRRFALISGHDLHGDRLRKRGIAAVLQEAGLDMARVPDERTNYDPAAGWEAACRLLTRRPRPTAVLAFDDTLALQMVRAAQEEGLDVPGDISVFGFGGAPHAALVRPALSTVQVPVAEGGRRAAEALCQAHLRGEPLMDILLPCTVCRRESDGPAPGAAVAQDKEERAHAAR